MALFNIDQYSVREWSSRVINGGNPSVAVAGIYLYEGSKYRGYVYFFPDGTPLAPPVYHSTSGRIFLHLNLSQLHATMDLLRNEDTIFVYYFSPNNAAIGCGREPTGEEE